MTRIRPSRRIERAGMNALRTLLEAGDHLVQEIDGGVDHGEDMYVSLTSGGRRTGHVVAVQVKSGAKYKRSSGYAIPVGNHHADWRRSRIPVFGVVFDPETRKLHWVNLTDELLKGPSAHNPSWIKIPISNELNVNSLGEFAISVQQYIDTRDLTVTETAGSPLSESVAYARKFKYRDSSESDVPNDAFDGIARFLLEHPRLMRWGRRAPLTVSMIGIAIMEWPNQIRFAQEYQPEVGPLRWTLTLYTLILYLLCIINSERKAGRFARGTRYLLAFIVGNYSVIPFLTSYSPGDHLFGQIWSTTLIIGAHLITVWITTWFVADAIDRRRRISTGQPTK
ncbi:DUF4365 domain-containing protein [Nocardia sp. NPDC059240]|uniref:DUF4365 domain-containing protein n=1 Tax=Nocardia sp. NPDC059240 TaxID=3346786 RepID=UPI0036868FC9